MGGDDVGSHRLGCGVGVWTHTLVLSVGLIVAVGVDSVGCGRTVDFIQCCGKISPPGLRVWVRRHELGPSG